MKILFIGCVESSYILLEKLVSINAEIVGVITKSESKVNADYRDLTGICKENNIEYIYINNINDKDCIDFAKKVNAEMAFCFGWSQLIKKEFLHIFPKGIVGYHPAALPYNRGRHPIIWALALGLESTASTFFMIDEKADTGSIVSQKTISISYIDNAKTLYDKLMKQACEQIVEIVNIIDKDKLILISQSQERGNTWRKRNIKDGEIDWRMSSYAIYNLVRALTYPYVGAHMVVGGKEIKVWKVEEILTEKYKNIEPGRIIKVYENGEFDIKAYDNLVRVIEYDRFDVENGMCL